MEQSRGETHQQEKPPTPLRCPRCNSLDTKFRYFNNHDHAQPRHHCRTCKRPWTVGGHLRNIPIGGKRRNGKQAKASSSRYGNPRSQPPQPTLPLAEEYLQNSQFPAQRATVIPQNFDTTMIHPVTNLPAAVSPLNSYNFNDEISCLDAILSLIQPDITNQHVDAGNQFSVNTATPQEWSMQTEVINQHVIAGNQFVRDGVNMAIPKEWSMPMATQQALPQQIPGHDESYQTHFQVNNVPLYHSYTNSLVQPTWPTNFTPDETNNFSFPTSSALLGNNSGGNTTKAEMDTASANVDEWLNFPDSPL